MHIDSVAELCETFHTASGTAPEFIIRCTVNLEIACSHRLEVGSHTCFGVLRGEDRVVICLLIEVHVLAVAGNFE